MPDSIQIEHAVNHLFRHQSGKMVAVLTRIFGAHNLELAEDVVHDTLLTALEQWKFRGIPDNPENWLFIVAKNKALNVIKKQRNQVLFGDATTQVLFQSGYTLETTFNQLAEESLIRDDQLRMMFACCHPGISEENQVTLILKTLCGFSTAEIAKAFLTSEDTISKRLYRTKAFFRQHVPKLEIPNPGEIRQRTEAVLNAIYLLFNEGYNSTQAEALIREDLIEEALILCKLLTERPDTQLPEVFALMALMCFHAARTDSRLTAEGEIILLPHQDRSTWNPILIELGREYLARAAFGESISTYHLEAAIAFEHCKAMDFEATDWAKILGYYDWLNQLAPSPVTEMNKAVAILNLHGPQPALEALEAIQEKQILDSYYLYYSLLGEIQARLFNRVAAAAYFQKAIDLTKSETERKMLGHKIEALGIG
jgi:RNA polymerase sigma-70 factor (ECF subfamily)